MSSVRTSIPRSIRGNVYGSFGVGDILDKPRCRLVQTAAQSIATATVTAITFDATGNTDTDGLFNASLPTHATIRTAGMYDVKANIAWAASAAGAQRDSWLQVNGSATPRFDFDFRAPSAGVIFCKNATSLTLNAGDYVELVGFQDSGGALLTTTEGGIHVCAELILCLISTT